MVRWQVRNEESKGGLRWRKREANTICVLMGVESNTAEKNTVSKG